MNKKYNTHLSLNERIVIQTGIENGATKTTIAQTLGRDLSTISKEIKRNVIIKPSRSNFNYGKEGQTSQCEKTRCKPRRL
ncbi:helix-turn-helix domain-containing protein [Erysipelothrix sp. D19-032]